MTDERLTHQDEEGRPRMVDVGDKAPTDRRAEAVGVLRMSADTLRTLRESGTPKGGPFTVARIAGIGAAKRTHELIPLCHLLPLSHVDVELAPDEELPGIRARATARSRGSTGVEMEALTAVSVALLTLYDMAKGMERGMALEGIRLVLKEGGRSGRWVAEPGPGSRDDTGEPPPRRT